MTHVARPNAKFYILTSTDSSLLYYYSPLFTHVARSNAGDRNSTSFFVSSLYYYSLSSHMLPAPTREIEILHPTREINSTSLESATFKAHLTSSSLFLTHIFDSSLHTCFPLQRGRLKVVYVLRSCSNSRNSMHPRLHNMDTHTSLRKFSS